MIPSDPSPDDGGEPPSPPLPVKPERTVEDPSGERDDALLEEEARVASLTAASARRTESALARLEEIQARVRAAVDTPEMRRLAEGIQRVIAEDRKRFAPLAEQVAKVQEEMARAFQLSGIGERLAEIERGFGASIDSRRAAEVLRKIEEESRLVPPGTQQLLGREVLLSGTKDEVGRRARDWERGLVESAGTAVAPAPPPAAPSSPRALDVAPRRERELIDRSAQGTPEPKLETREMVQAAVEAGLRSVFPPEFVRFVMEWMGRASAPGLEVPRFDGPTEPLTWKEAAERMGLGNRTKDGNALRERVRAAADGDALALLRLHRIRHQRKSSCRADVVEYLRKSMVKAVQEAGERAAAIRAEKSAANPATVEQTASKMTRLLGRLQ